MISTINSTRCSTFGISRQSLGWQIVTCGNCTVKKLMDRIDDGICFFITDEWPGFVRLLPEHRHVYGKDLTFPIEQTNSDIRHWRARFVRRTKASSRSLEMVDLSLKLYHHFQDPANQQSILKSFLSLFG